MWDMSTNIRVLGFNTLLYAVADFSDVRWRKCNLRQTTINQSALPHPLSLAAYYPPIPDNWSNINFYCCCAAIIFHQVAEKRLKKQLNQSAATFLGIKSEL